MGSQCNSLTKNNNKADEESWLYNYNKMSITNNTVDDKTSIFNKLDNVVIVSTFKNVS